MHSLSKSAILKNYTIKCGNFSIHTQKEQNTNIVYIETERFIAHTLYTPETVFHKFPPAIQQLYEVTFGDPIVMEKYKYGISKTIQEFEDMIYQRSLHTLYNNALNAFIIKDRRTKRTIGYTEIDQSDQPGAGEVAYLFSKQYHNTPNTAYRYVGYENVGALIWGYAAQLYTRRVLIPQPYCEEYKRLKKEFSFKKYSLLYI